MFQVIWLPEELNTWSTTMRFLLTLALSACLFSSPVTAEDAFPSHTVKWSLDLADKPLAPTLFPDAMEPTGVVVAAGKELTLVGGNGEAEWGVSFENFLGTPPTVADLTGDGKVEIVVAQQDGIMVCLDAAGNERWRYDFETRTGGFNFIIAEDVHGSPGLELLFGGEDGWLNCVSAEGEVLWRFFGDTFWVGPPAVGDVDGDGFTEIVYGTDDGHVYCLATDGTVKWRYAEPMGEFAPYGRSGANLADVDGDGSIEVLLTRSNVVTHSCLMALDGATGLAKWRTRDVLHGYVSNATVDFDGDGLLETLHTDKSNWLYCVNADGGERWRTPLAGHGIFFAPTVGDLNGDGALEIFVGVRDTDHETGKTAYVVSAKGKILEHLQLGKSAKSGSAMGDIDRDGKLEVLAVTEGPNQLVALTWRGEGRVAWPSVRGSSTMNAQVNVPRGVSGTAKGKAALRPLGVEQDQVFFGDNVAKVSWDGPADDGTFASIACHGKDGYWESRVVPIRMGATEADLPWRIARGGKFDLSITLAGSNGAGSMASWQSRPTVLDPDYCDFAGLRKACEQALDIGADNGVDTSGIRARLMTIDAMRQALGEARQSTSVLASQATALRHEAESLRGLCQVLTAAWQTDFDGSFLCWQDENPWDRFDPLAAPGQAAKTVTVTIAAFGEEFEDIALNLLNVSSKAIDVRCSFVEPSRALRGVPPEPELAKHMTLRRGVRVASQKSGMVNDILPALDRSRTVRLAPGEATQLWVVVDTHGLESGSHTLTLYLGSIDEQPSFVEVPLTIEVSPVRLPVGVYAQMNWVGTDIDVTSDQQLKDMIDHGISVAYGPNLPAITVDANGDAAGPVDWSHFDAGLARLPDYFQLLFHAPPRVVWPKDVTAPADSDLGRKGFATAVLAMRDHLREQGYGYDRWGLYPVDEPWLTGFTLIPILRDFCTKVKAADPKIRNYTDPSGMIRIEYISEFKDLIDIWQPEMNQLKRSPELTKWFQDNVRVLWAYEATDPGKDLHPLGYYRGYGWLAWMFGLDGAGFWCYKYNDIYWPLDTSHWSVVYQTGDEVVPSRRWEACRDGQEDYRLFYALREALNAAREKGHTDDAGRAQALLDEAVENVIAWQARTIDEVTRQTRDYELDFELLMSYRTRLGEETLRLQKLVE
jgi:FG-GAP-like repeat